MIIDQSKFLTTECENNRVDQVYETLENDAPNISYKMNGYGSDNGSEYVVGTRRSYANLYKK